MSQVKQQEVAMSTVPNGAQKTIAILDGLSICVGKTTAWLAIPMMFSLIYEVVMRYIFNLPTIWAMDIAIMLYGIHFMLGSPYCLQTGQHIRTDFFYHSWSVKTRAAVDMFNYIVFFFPVHIIFLELAWAYAYKSFLQNEVSVTSPWMPYIWPAKMAIPICLALTLTQGFSEVLKSFYRWKTGEHLWPTANDAAEMAAEAEMEAKKSIEQPT